MINLHFMWAVSVMIVNLLKTTDDTRKIDKTIATIKNINALPTEPTNILTPALIIERDNLVLSANYMYIPDFARYYYITGFTMIKGNRIIISGKVDVLKTYGTQLQNCNCIVTRSESIGTPSQIPDSNLPIDPNREEIKSIIFDKDPFNIDATNTAKCWQLTTNGGEPIGN